MLAKQCWRLISKPDSLCASILRAKYFPSGDLLSCPLKKEVLIPGKVFGLAFKLLKEGTFGGLEMVRISTYGMIAGSHVVRIGEF